MEPIRTRIAPSPTGDPHVGTVYIALFNLAFARHFGGKFILRIEDTDQKRSLPIYEQNIYKALEWAGITWDEGPDKGGSFGPYRQSERLDIYQKYIQILLDKKAAYKCFATKEELSQMREAASKAGKKTGYDRRYRDLSDEEVAKREKNGESYVIRLKVPLSGECVFEDKIKGKITYPWDEIDDQVLMKSDGFPTYHFAAVVDDHLMEISHVIRGDEWISSTPKHILLYEAFGWKVPIYMHMPLLLGKDGRKLSKRRNPTSVFYFRDSGFLPEALLNFLSLMGYSMPDEREFYSFNELVKDFDPSRFGKSGAFFDAKKLEWLNQKYIIETLSNETLLSLLKKNYFNDEFLQKLLPLAKPRMKTLADFTDVCDFLFINNLDYTDDLLVPKNRSKKDVTLFLQTMLWSLEEKEDWSGASIEATSHETATLFDINHKKILMPVLFGTIMGKRNGPPLFASAEILGKERVRARMLTAIEFLGGISSSSISELKKGIEAKSCSHLLTPPQGEGVSSS